MDRRGLWRDASKPDDTGVRSSPWAPTYTASSRCLIDGGFEVRLTSGGPHRHAFVGATYSIANLYLDLAYSAVRSRMPISLNTAYWSWSMGGDHLWPSVFRSTSNSRIASGPTRNQSDSRESGECLPRTKPCPRAILRARIAREQGARPTYDPSNPSCLRCPC